MKKRSLWLCPLAIAAIVALDQWVKAYIVTHFAVGESAEFLPQLLRLHYVRNFGAAWSSFSGERWLLIGVTGVGMLALAWLLARMHVHRVSGFQRCGLLCGLRHHRGTRLLHLDLPEHRREELGEGPWNRSCSGQVKKAKIKGSTHFLRRALTA